MEAVDEKTISRVNHLFFYSNLLRKAVHEAREQQEAHGGVPTGGGGHARISDPTANTAVKRIMPLKCVNISTPQYGNEKITLPEAWLHVIDKTFKLYEKPMAGTCMRARYISHEKPETIMSKMGIGKSTYYSWRDDFLRDAVLIAVHEGLIFL